MTNGEDTRHLFRWTDPDTSREAAEYIVQHLHAIQREVWDYAVMRGDEGFTHREMADYMARQHNSNQPQRCSTHRTRCAELRDIGMIADTGRRRVHTGNNRKHVVWARVPRGD